MAFDTPIGDLATSVTFSGGTASFENDDNYTQSRVIFTREGRIVQH
jgi:hypothetical protein